MPAIPVLYQDIPNVLLQMFDNEETRGYANHLIAFIHDNFGDAIYITTGNGHIADLRVKINHGHHFFILKPSFAIIVYLQNNVNYDYNFGRNNADFTMTGVNALNQMGIDEGKMIKDYIRMSYTHRDGNQHQQNQEIQNPIINTPKNELKMLPLNTILYGAPGTGKTFSVVDYAYAIINQTEFDDSKEKRAERKKDFDEKVGSQISFVTFHQSFSYEEFVEGIRAETNEDGTLTIS